MENKNPEIINLEAEEVTYEVGTSIEKAEVFLTKLNETGELVLNSVQAITSTIENVKSLNFQIKQMEVDFELKLKEYDLRIEKAKLHATTIQMTLDRASSTVDKILDKVLDMDIENDNPQYIQKRSELMDQLRNASDNLAMMFITFMKY
ncbi:hypothetical protein KI659_17750 [Litoribacter alkaliphilus]|uniref:Uncharacterized protein n=1 Tax=Litoribacter ruber TaxID=702568 RepID=A0AAP2CNN4_9BACT|nr:hypothetical protein [Litoribacter alkaliphilus]MBS9525870.1 hypothetical protein [Litoribacter alkaliphilus]